MKGIRLAACLISACSSFFYSLSAYAYEYYTAPPSGIPPLEGSKFSINTGELSCTNGTGTPPSFFVGAHAGRGNMNNSAMSDPIYNESTGDFFYRSSPSGQNDNYLTGLIGFNIPLGRMSNNESDCTELLAIIEAKGFLEMLQKMKELGVLDEAKSLALIYAYMKSTGKKLGLDLSSALMKPEFYVNNSTPKILDKIRQ